MLKRKMMDSGPPEGGPGGQAYRRGIMSKIMQRDEEIAYWRKLFYAAKDALEVWKWWNLVESLMLVASVLLNLYCLTR